MPPSRLARFGGEKKIKERYKNKVQNKNVLINYPGAVPRLGLQGL